MGAPPSFLVILFLPPLFSGLCLQPRDVMTLPLHYWLVLSGDPPLLFLCHSLQCVIVIWQFFTWWQKISLGCSFDPFLLFLFHSPALVPGRWYMDVLKRRLCYVRAVLLSLVFLECDEFHIDVIFVARMMASVTE